MYSEQLGPDFQFICLGDKYLSIWPYFVCTAEELLKNPVNDLSASISEGLELLKKPEQQPSKTSGNLDCTFHCVNFYYSFI